MGNPRGGQNSSGHRAKYSYGIDQVKEVCCIETEVLEALDFPSTTEPASASFLPVAANMTRPPSPSSLPCPMLVSRGGLATCNPLLVNQLDRYLTKNVSILNLAATIIDSPTSTTQEVQSSIVETKEANADARRDSCEP